MWNLIGTNEPIYRTETDSHREQTCGCQEGGRRSGMDGEFVVSRGKLSHLERTGNEVLLYSTGSCVQSLGYMMGDDMRRRICVCMNDWVTLMYMRSWHSTVHQR